MNEPETPKVYEYLAKELPENAVVGINGKLFSAFLCTDHEGCICKEKYPDQQPDRLCKRNLGRSSGRSATEIYNLGVEYAGKTAAEKTLN